MKKIFTLVIGIVAMCATACSEYREVTDGDPLTLERYEIDSEGGYDQSFSLRFTSVADLKLSSDCNWISVPESVSCTAEKITIKVQSNNSINERVGHITAKIADATFGVEYSKTITIKQSRGEARLQAYDNEDNYSSSISIGSRGVSSGCFYVKSNVDFTISKDGEYDWVTINRTSGKGNPDEATAIYYSVDAYLDAGDRYCYIQIASVDKTLGAEFTIHQKSFERVWKVSPVSGELIVSPYASDENSIGIFSNLSWSASCDAEWITLKNTSHTCADPHWGGSSSSLDFSTTLNDTFISRSATITIESNEGHKTKICVIQETVSEIEFIHEGEYLVKYTDDSYSVGMWAQGDWVATANTPDWLTITTPSGSSGQQKLSFNVKHNDDATDYRSAVITLALKDSPNTTATLQVVQDHKNTLYFAGGIFYEEGAGTILDAEVDKYIPGEYPEFAKVTFKTPLTTILASGNSNSWQNGMVEIILPATVTTIGEKAFYNCTTLRSIELPASLQEIGRSAFKHNLKLESVTIRATEPPQGGVSMFKAYDGGYTPSCLTIKVPTASVNKYKTAEYWSEYADHIEDGGF